MGLPRAAVAIGLPQPDLEHRQHAGGAGLDDGRPYRRDNKKKYVISLFIASVIIIYLIQLYRPDLIVDFPSDKVRWIDSLITVIYSSFLIFLIIKFLHKNYTLERQRAEKNETQLRELNATKDKFFSIIAHDLKSPLNIILGFSNLLAIQIRDKNHEGIEKCAEMIQKSSFNAMDLLKNL